MVFTPFLPFPSPFFYRMFIYLFFFLFYMFCLFMFMTCSGSIHYPGNWPLDRYTARKRWRGTLQRSFFFLIRLSTKMPRWYFWRPSNLLHIYLYVACIQHYYFQEFGRIMLNFQANDVNLATISSCIMVIAIPLLL